jgi:hypothetical protein
MVQGFFISPVIYETLYAYLYTHSPESIGRLRQEL